MISQKTIDPFLIKQQSYFEGASRFTRFRDTILEIKKLNNQLDDSSTTPDKALKIEKQLDLLQNPPKKAKPVSTKKKRKSPIYCKNNKFEKLVIERKALKIFLKKLLLDFSS